MQSSSRVFSLVWSGRIAALAGALVLLVVGLPRAATAENPELAGEWVLVPKKSKNLGALETVRQWISFDGNNMTIARKAEYIEQPDNVYEYVYIIDGEPHMMKDSSGAGGENGERETTVDWKGWSDDRLEAKWNFQFNGVTIKATETWELKNKGKDLLIEREFEHPMGETGHKHYYTRVAPKEGGS